MTQNDAERMLEIEEAAEGVDLFRPPGAQLQVEKARDQAEASGWIPAADSLGGRRFVRLESVRSHRDELKEAMTDLETSVARPLAHTGWSHDVGISLTRLRHALEGHIRVVEGPDGLFEEVLATAPRLAHDAEVLEREHEDLIDSIGIVTQILDDPSARALTRRRVMSLIAQLIVHRQRGSDLVYNAYNLDIGDSG